MNNIRNIITLLLLAVICCSSQSLCQEESLWTPIIGPLGQPLSALGQTSEGHMLVGGATGLYVSTDAGQSWRRNSPDVYVVSIFRAIKGTMLIGTFEGLLRSSDGGRSWHPTRGGEHLDAKCSDSLGNIYAVDPNLNGYVWRSSDDGISWSRLDLKFPRCSFYYFVTDQCGTVLCSTNIGVVRSTNNGLTWSRSDKSSFGKGLVLPVEHFALTPDSTIWVIGQAGLFASRDRGRSWSRMDSNLPPALVNSFIITPGGTMYASCRHLIFKSIDRGRTWLQCPRSDDYTSYVSLMADSNGFLYAASIGLQRSVDSGKTWRACNTGLGNDGVHVLAINPEGHLFAATAWNLFKSTDDGKEWAYVDSSQHISGVKRIIACSDSLVILAINGGGVSVSTNNGRQWAPRSLGSREIDSFVRDRAGTLYAATPGGRFSSSDNGKSWRCDGYDDVIMFATNSRGTVLVGTSERYEQILYKVYRLKHGTGDLVPITLDTSNAVSLLPSNGSSLFVACDGHLHFSTDDGVSWVRSDSSAPFFIQEIVETNEGVLFAADKFRGVYMSVDHGYSWRNFSKGLPKVGADMLAIHPDGRLFVATRRGIYRTIRPVSTLNK